MMPERILGIDIDENSLKAVLAVRRMRGGYRVEEALIIELSDAGGVAGAIDKLREKVDFRQVRINLSLPAKHISFHNVKLPFRDEKKIRQTIAYELETILPRSIDECLLDYCIISQAKHAEIFAAVVPRSLVKERLSLFGEHPPEIGMVGVDALPVASWLLANGILIGPGLLLHVGVKDTVAVFVRQGIIVQVRHFDAPHPDCRRFCRELGNTIEFMKYSGIMEDGPDRIFLTGDAAGNLLIREELARYFSLPVETVDLAMLSGIHLPNELKKACAPSSMNQALALALLKHEKGRGFNFSLRGLEAKSPPERYGSSLKCGAAVASFIILLMVANAYTDYRYARLRLDNLKKQINVLFKSAAPEVARVVDPVQQLKLKIAEMKKMPVGRGEISATVLDLLKDISASAPPATEFMITSFNLDDDRVAIKGTAKNFDSVDTLKREFARSKNFKTVEIGATSLVKQGDKVEFDLRMTTQR
jgi:general secretion pathway protein L